MRSWLARWVEALGGGDVPAGASSLDPRVWREQLCRDVERARLGPAEHREVVVGRGRTIAQAEARGPAAILATSERVAVARIEWEVGNRDRALTLLEGLAEGLAGQPSCVLEELVALATDAVPWASDRRDLARALRLGEAIWTAAFDDREVDREVLYRFALAFVPHGLGANRFRTTTQICAQVVDELSQVPHAGPDAGGEEPGVDRDRAALRRVVLFRCTMWLALGLAGRGDAVRAQAMTERAATLLGHRFDIDEARALVACQAWQASRRGDFVRAEQLWGEVAEVAGHPMLQDHGVFALLGLGFAYVDLGLGREARGVAKRACEVAPEGLEAMLLRARAELLCDELDEASVQATRVCERRPANPLCTATAEVVLGEIALRRGRVDEAYERGRSAVAHAREILEEPDPLLAEALALVGRTARDEVEARVAFDEALASFVRVGESNPAVEPLEHPLAKKIRQSYDARFGGARTGQAA